jgi:predicted Rdx family selenoprotein
VHFYIYPVVALFVAFRWWLRARVLMREQQEQFHEAIPEASVMVASGGDTQIKATEVV